MERRDGKKLTTTKKKKLQKICKYTSNDGLEVFCPNEARSKP